MQNNIKLCIYISKRKEKACENRGLEWEPQVKQTALLASPSYIEQTQGEEKKEKNEPLSLLLLGWPALMAQDLFLFACQIKLSVTKL